MPAVSGKSIGPPAEGPPPTEMLDSLVSYLRRQVGDAGPTVALVGLGQSIRQAPADAGIVVVAGRRSRLGELPFRRRSGLHPQWRGLARADPTSPGLDFAVWDRWPIRGVGDPPSDFDVLAIVTTYNEQDIVAQALDRLVGGGIRVHVIDNWSTDATPEIVSRYLDSGRVSMERWPADGKSDRFELRRLLGRVSAVAHQSGADWVIHHDTDEIHQPPWPGVPLRQALWAVTQWGFNCVDYTAVDFRPVDDSWTPGDDLETSFDWFEFGSSHAHFTLLRAWRPQAVPVTNAESGGHSADFEGRRVFPYKFLLRHYSLRSPEHARRKLFVERRPRWDPEERSMGWHHHYDDFSEADSFVWDRSALHRWSTVDEELLVQRLSGVWLPNNPQPAEARP